VSPARQRPLLAIASALALDQRRLVWATALVILVLVLVAHMPLRHSGYVQDDHVAVEQNPIVERGDLGEIFSTSYWAGARGDDRSLYRPVPVLTYALERKATGEPAPLLSHAVNVGLHLLCTFLLLLLLRRLGIDLFAAAAAALIFAVHPIHVEAVGGIVGRAEILAALFSFAGLLALSHAGPWVAGDESERPVARWRLAAWLAALMLFLALGAKEVALATPLLYVALELLFRPRGEGPRRAFWVGRAAALAPSGLAALLYVILRTRALEALVAMQQAHPSDNPLLLLEGASRLGTALGLVARYARLLLYPVGLSADYSGPVIRPAAGLATGGAVVGTLILLGCLALALRPLTRRGAGDGARHWSFAALLFLLPYLIIGNLLFLVGTIFAERLLYFPSAGFCLMVGLLLGTIASSPAYAGDRDAARPSSFSSSRAAALALSVLLAGFMVLTWARARDWRDDETLFRASAQAQPRSPRAHHIVGKMLADRGEPEEALPWFDRALELYPAYVQVWNERGAVHGRLGDLRRAEADFREAVRLRPEYADAQLNLALTLRMQGDLAGAERSLRRALLWDPVLSSAWAELGNLFLQIGRYDEAIQAYRKGIALGRSDLVERLREAARRAAPAPPRGGP
jgi:tetratricopeptide (TPR) repeat protein